MESKGPTFQLPSPRPTSPAWENMQSTLEEEDLLTLEEEDLFCSLKQVKLKELHRW
jgi:hypothetical protein